MRRGDGKFGSDEALSKAVMNLKQELIVIMVSEFGTRNRLPCGY